VDVGPVEPAVVEGLRGIEEAWPPAAEGPWVEDRGGRLYFTSRGDHCVFLRDDGRCAIHVLRGSEAKPGVCRAFPFHVLRDPRGLALVARADCTRLHESFRDGVPVAERAEDIVALPRVDPYRTFAPERVRVVPGVVVSADRWMAMEEAVLARLDRNRASPEAAVAGLREHLFSLLSLPAPDPDPGEFEDAWTRVVERLGEVVGSVRAQRRAWLEHVGRAGAGDVQDRMLRALGAAVGAAAARSLPPMDGDSVDYLHLVLRSEVLAKEWQLLGSVSAGLGLFLAATNLARRGAAADRLAPNDIGAVLPHWKRFVVYPAVLPEVRRLGGLLDALFLNATAG